MDEPDHLPRHELALSFARLLVVVIAVATVVRPLFVTLDPLFTWLGVLNTGLAAAVYVLVRTDRIRRFEAALILALGMVCILPLLLISGGVNSQFAFLIPIYPLAATMLGGNRLAQWVCALWVVILVALMAAAPAIPDITGEIHHPGKTASRGVWALLGVLVATAIGVYFHNVSERMARALHRQATSDHLTGLANRRALEAAIDRELARLARSGGRLSLLMLDVDHFKRFNDRHGHAAGDVCLQEIARCLMRFTRDGQDLVGRYGGEEFVVLLGDTDRAAATAVAEKLRRAVAAQRHAGGREPVTVTVGIATAGTDGTLPSRDELIRRADAALYLGKAAGRDRVVHADARPHAA